MTGRMFRIIMAFRTTTDAMAMEAFCQARGIPGRLIPLPSIISAGCGLCWSAPEEAREAVTGAAGIAGIEPDGIYMMLL